MASHLKKKPIHVRIENLYVDPNNPRLALENKPGYDDADVLFGERLQEKIIAHLGEAAYNVDDLVTAIVGQGWMPVDNIIVWKHPDGGDRYVVLEGNRRRLALERIRTDLLKRERRTLERIEKRAKSFDTAQIEEHRQAVARLERIVGDTDTLSVIELDAETTEELGKKLPRVLAVRHITGTKGWGGHAEDLWLLERFDQLFFERHGEGAARFWDEAIIHQVADEASLGHTKTKWHLKSSSWFSRFQADFEGELPKGEEFKPSDYYLFELIAQRRWVKEQFDIDDEAFHFPEEMARTLFDWVFKFPRPGTADENLNVFYRHENIQLWDRMKRYDDQHGTSFASRFDTTRSDEAPTMREVEAEWLPHKARQEPRQMITALLRRLHNLKADDLAGQGNAFRAQLDEVRKKAEQFIKMIDAARA